MYYNNPFDIPQELLGDKPGQVNLLVGENGSGKSSLLDEISRRMVNFSNRKVVAIANTIHDKFRTRHERFEALKAAHGRSIVKRTLKSALQMLIEKNESRFSQVAETLRYVHFDPAIGIKVAGLKRDFQSRLKYNDLPDEQQQVLISLLERYQHSISSNWGEEIVRIDLYRENFYELQSSGILELLSFEAQLRKFKLIREIEVYLYKDGRPISANLGSSGELTLITSFIYLMTTVEHGTIILIDEPENSLHPKWQVEYVGKLYDLIYRYEPTTFIATHSPLIINSAELDLGYRLRIFKGVAGSFRRIEDFVGNVEQIYQDFFDVTTPENRFLSQFVLTKLNQLANKTISIAKFTEIITELRESAYDERQVNVLNGVIEMGQRISARQN